MNLMQFPQMLVSTHAGWDEVERLRPEMGTMFLRLVLPLSLLPPLMIVYASTAVGAHVFPDASHETWLLAAYVFLHRRASQRPPDGGLDPPGFDRQGSERQPA